MKILLALLLVSLPSPALANSVKCVGEARHQNREDKIHTTFFLRKIGQLDFYELSFSTGFQSQTFYAPCLVHPADGRLFDCNGGGELKIDSSLHSVERIGGAESFIEIQGQIPAGLNPALSLLVKFASQDCESETEGFRR